ncbi:MAG: urease accessory UreF family protein [Pseudomonadota bacterium]|nr:urease accessory UreF family protein [Pseudomonadota bacterium]
MATDIELHRLLHLASATLPTGAFAYSQGLETAVEARWIQNREQTEGWLETVLHTSLKHQELPLLHRAMQALAQGDATGLRHLNQEAIAWRDTAELRAEERQLGRALQRMLEVLHPGRSPDWFEAAASAEGVSYLAGYACLARLQGLDATTTATAYAWSWLENQVAAAIKLVPLGQSEAHQALASVAAALPAVVAAAARVAMTAIGHTLPGLSLASAQHETQYSRLFRS